MSNTRRRTPSELELMREHARLAAELAETRLALAILETGDPDAVAEVERRLAAGDE